MTIKLKIDKVQRKKKCMPFKNHYLMEIKCELLNISKHKIIISYL